MNLKCPECTHEWEGISENAKEVRRRNGSSPKAGHPYKFPPETLNLLWKTYLQKEDANGTWTGPLFLKEIEKLVGSSHNYSLRSTRALLKKMRERDPHFWTVAEVGRY